jgi:hypothetical protein
LGLNQRLREITPQKEFTWGPNDIWMNWAELISLGLGIAQVYLPIFPQNDNQLPLATALALSPIALTWIWKMGAFAQQKLSNCLCSKRAYLSSETHKRNQRILEDQCRLISLILLFRNREYLGDPDQGKLIERMINCAREVISKWPQTPSFFASLFVDERLSIDYDFDLPRELCEP